jgi:hypothetical protein
MAQMQARREAIQAAKDTQAQKQVGPSAPGYFATDNNKQG